MRCPHIGSMKRPYTSLPSARHRAEAIRFTRLQAESNLRRFAAIHPTTALNLTLVLLCMLAGQSVTATAQTVDADSVLKATPPVIINYSPTAQAKQVTALTAANIVKFDDGDYAGLSFDVKGVPTELKVTNASSGLGQRISLREGGKLGQLVPMERNGNRTMTLSEVSSGKETASVTIQDTKGVINGSTDFMDVLSEAKYGDDLESILVQYQEIDPAMAMAMYQKHFLKSQPFDKSIRETGVYIGLKNEKRYKTAESDGPESFTPHTCECTTVAGNVQVNPGIIVNANPDYIYGLYDSQSGNFDNGVDWYQATSRESTAFYMQAHTDANNASGTSTLDVQTGTDGGAATNFQRMRFRLTCTEDGRINGRECDCSKQVTIEYQADAEYLLDGQEKSRFPPGDKRVETLSAGGAALLVDRDAAPIELLDAGMGGLEMNCSSSWNFEDVLISALNVAATLATVEVGGGTPTPGQITTLRDGLIAYINSWENVVNRSGNCGSSGQTTAILNSTTNVTINANENLWITLASFGQAYSSGFGKWRATSRILFGGRLAAVVDGGGGSCCSDRIGLYVHDDVGPESPVTNASYAQATGNFFGLYSPQWDNIYRYPNSSVDVIEGEASYPEFAIASVECGVIEDPGPGGGVIERHLQLADHQDAEQAGVFPGGIRLAPGGNMILSPDIDIDDVVLSSLDGRVILRRKTSVSAHSQVTLESRQPSTPLVLSWRSNGITQSQIFFQ